MLSDSLWQPAVHSFISKFPQTENFQCSNFLKFRFSEFQLHSDFAVITQWNWHLFVLVADPSAHVTLHAQLIYRESEREEKAPKRERVHCSDFVHRFLVSYVKLRESKKWESEGKTTNQSQDSASPSRRQKIDLKNKENSEPGRKMWALLM